jgi:hypothetical protein
MKDRCRIRIGRNRKSEAGFRDAFGSFSLVLPMTNLGNDHPAFSRVMEAFGES